MAPWWPWSSVRWEKFCFNLPTILPYFYIRKCRIPSTLIRLRNTPIPTTQSFTTSLQIHLRSYNDHMYYKKKILSTHSSALYTSRTLTQGRLTSRHIRRPNFQNHWPQSPLTTAQGTYQVTKSVEWIQRHTLRYNIHHNLLQAYCRCSINSALPNLQLSESFSLKSSLLSLARGWVIRT